MAKGSVTIDGLDKDGKAVRYWLLNEKIHDAAAEGYKHVVIKGASGQRFIGACMEQKDLRIDIHGTPGNDLGVFMSGPTIEVFGNAQDQTGNTMNDGTIIVHGNAWDVTGLAVRGGKIFVQGDGGYRIGIHMKEYKDQKPVIVYGGKVKEFFGEYMAGGTLVALGMRWEDGKIKDLPSNEVVRGSIGSGIHGGAIYVRGKVEQHQLGVGASVQQLTQEDEKALMPILKDFCTYFKADMDQIWAKDLVKVAASSSRPYRSYYNPRSI